MLVEDEEVQQSPGEGPRRWFSDADFDLIVWYAGDEIVGFQLCYDKGRHERALTWQAPDRFLHARVDDGEKPARTKRGHKKAPILVADGLFEAARIADEFRAASASLEPELAALVDAKLRAFPAAP